LVKAASLTYSVQYPAIILNEKLEYAMQIATANWEYHRREIQHLLQIVAINTNHPYKKGT